MARMGSGYIASDTLKVSIGNDELIPVGNSCYKFSFDNEDACQVIINNMTTAYLKANKGVDFDTHDAPIYSFVVITPNIKYTFFGGI